MWHTNPIDSIYELLTNCHSYHERTKYKSLELSLFSRLLHCGHNRISNKLQDIYTLCKNSHASFQTQPVICRAIFLFVSIDASYLPASLQFCPRLFHTLIQFHVFCDFFSFLYHARYARCRKWMVPFYNEWAKKTGEHGKNRDRKNRHTHTGEERIAKSPTSVDNPNEFISPLANNSRPTWKWFINIIGTQTPSVHVCLCVCGCVFEFWFLLMFIIEVMHNTHHESFMAIHFHVKLEFLTQTSK